MPEAKKINENPAQMKIKMLELERQSNQVLTLRSLGWTVGSMACSFALATLKRNKGITRWIGLLGPFVVMALYNKFAKSDISEPRKVLH